MGATKFLLHSIAVVSAFQVRWASGGVFQPRGVHPIPADECPESCSGMFTKLEEGPDGEGLVQKVEMQQRGEPKSGTGFMFEWASAALAQTCLYLMKAYGRESCRMETYDMHTVMTFEPRLADWNKDVECSCDDVTKVTIDMSRVRKHTLPCEPECAWYHLYGIARPDNAGCKPPYDGAPPAEDLEGLWKCMDEAACDINDDRLQMAVMRDPRAMAVSAYFHRLKHESKVLKELNISSVDDHFLRMLPALCRWTSVRYKLFSETLGDRTAMYWYDEPLENPWDWHRHMLEFLGLNVPSIVLKKAVSHATKGKLVGFGTKGIDEHPGGQENTVTRTYRGEITPGSLAAADEIMRTWLPQELLDRFGVPSK
ncbi:unnamed protein product [Scytosiphon promiscuus]